MLSRLCAVAALAVALPAWAHGTGNERRAAIERQIVLAPGNPHAHLRRAAEGLAAGETEAALAAVATARTLGADPAACELLQGRIALAAARPAEARDAATRALQAGAGADAHRLRGRALLELGQHAAAGDAFVAAIGTAPVPGPDDYLDAARALHAGGDPVRALAVLDAGIDRLGALAALQQLAIELEVERRFFDAAVTRLDLLLARNPRNRHWLQQRRDLLSPAPRGRARLQPGDS